MPTIRIRTVGVSYSIEGFEASGLDPGPLLAHLAAAHGPAVAAVGIPPEAILIDRKALSWSQALERIEAWVRARGFAKTSWVDAEPPAGSAATLHFRA